MAVQRSSSGGSSAVKASLVLMLLFGAVVAAHASHVVAVENKLCKDILCNGILIKVGHVVDVDIELGMILTDVVGTVLSLGCSIAKDVTRLTLYQVGGLLKIKVGAVTGLLGALLGTVVTVVGTVLCSINVGALC